MISGRVVEVNGRWPIWLPDHRADRPQWTDGRGWERERLDSMHDLLGPGDVVYDIGTEEGDMSALVASWVRGCTDVTCPCQDGDACHYEDLPGSPAMEPPDGWRRGGVVLIEPNCAVWPNPKAIWDANGLPDPVACFAGFAADEMRGDPDPDGLWGWPACADGQVIGDHGFLRVEERPDVPSCTIDWLSQAVGAPSAITMDIEGAELLALRGAETVLLVARPRVWVSVHPVFMEAHYGHTPEMLYEFMAAVGYRSRLLAVDHEHHVLFEPV